MTNGVTSSNLVPMSQPSPTTVAPTDVALWTPGNIDDMRARMQRIASNVSIVDAFMAKAAVLGDAYRKAKFAVAFPDKPSSIARLEREEEDAMRALCEFVAPPKKDKP